MSNKLPLDSLIELARSKNEDATRRLGQLQNNRTCAAEKLQMLLQYRQDYVDQMQEKMLCGVESSYLRNFQDFIVTLDGAIEQQRAVTLQADSRLEHGRGDWKFSKRRLNSFETLASRVCKQEMMALGKAEQRDSDERTSRRFYLQSSKLAA